MGLNLYHVMIGLQKDSLENYWDGRKLTSD